MLKWNLAGRMIQDAQDSNKRKKMSAHLITPGEGEIPKRFAFRNVTLMHGLKRNCSFTIRQFWRAAIHGVAKSQTRLSG